MQMIRNVLERLGYYCPGCKRYKKTFSPPLGRRVCLSCHSSDANEHIQELGEINIRRKQGLMSDAELVNKLSSLRSRHMPKERKDE